MTIYELTSLNYFNDEEEILEKIKVVKKTELDSLIKSIESKRFDYFVKLAEYKAVKDMHDEVELERQLYNEIAAIRKMFDENRQKWIYEHDVLIQTIESIEDKLNFLRKKH